MNFQEYKPLTRFNTFGLESMARYFVEVSTVDELQKALLFAKEHGLRVVPLGEGSNVVLGEVVDGLVIHIALKGRSLKHLSESPTATGSAAGDDKSADIRVTAGAGECWHDVVRWSIAQGAFGLENLSLIPGTVGAAPIQNIGAYGVELKDVFYSLEALDIASGSLKRFYRDECQFGYRDSVFKHRLRDRYIITSVAFNLDSDLKPKLDYGPLQERINTACTSTNLSAELISNVITDIRQEKLPDPNVLGNAGSFFKNPVINHPALEKLKQTYPDIVAYPVEAGKWKLAAGWLIEKAGLRGYQQGAVGTHKRQALVLVNYGGASGQEIVAFSDRVRSRVLDQFGVELEVEPRVY